MLVAWNFHDDHSGPGGGATVPPSSARLVGAAFLSLRPSMAADLAAEGAGSLAAYRDAGEWKSTDAQRRLHA